jgi:DNA-binding CsgD family transcriptional regulator
VGIFLTLFESQFCEFYEVNMFLNQFVNATNLGSLHPSLAIPVAKEDRFATEEQPQTWLHCLLNEVGFGILILNEQLEVHFCNHTARQALGKVGLSCLSGHDSDTSGECLGLHRRKISEFYAQAKLAAKGQRKFVLLGDDVDQIVVALSPINLGEQYLQFGVLVTTERKSVCKSSSLWAYGKALALTASELKVLHLLADGDGPKIVAENLKVSVTTVRSHIRSIIDKTASANLREVLLKVSKLPPMSSVSLT